MSARSYARIEWLGSALGLRMVNGQGESYLLHAEPLIMLQRKAWVLAKFAHQHPEKCIRSHGGEVWATMQIRTSGETVVKLSFINVGRRIRVSPDDQANDVMAVQEYVFPTAELACFRQAVEMMMNQRAEFDMLKMDADTSPV